MLSHLAKGSEHILALWTATSSLSLDWGNIARRSPAGLSPLLLLCLLAPGLAPGHHFDGSLLLLRSQDRLPEHNKLGKNRDRAF